LFCLIHALRMNGQCAGGVTSYPYVEDFETSPAWTPGGPTYTPGGTTISDWTWGTPANTVINSAGSGSKCWNAGGLSGTFYAYGERSYIQSPCFNFTNVVHPYIQFKIWWESEYRYDGTNLQYSLDNGANWLTVGTSSDPTDCMDANWYNFNNITNLGQYSHSLPGHGNTTYTFQSMAGVGANGKNGWSGNTQVSYNDTTGISGSLCQGGSGSAHWVTAKHCMPYLAGRQGVIFRFTFGAGTSCNNFNGISIDSIAIGEGTPNTANFSYSCVNTNTLSFTGAATACSDTFQWNFGDPASGASNTIPGAGSLTATHTFSGPGTYNVTFTVKGGPCNAPGTMTKTVHILGVTTNPVNVPCNGGSNGAIIAVVAGAATPYSYTWSTTPAQHTDTAAGLGVGTYTVTVTTPNACSATGSGSISQPTALTHTSTTTAASCGASNGAAKVIESNGTPPYIYLWSNGLGTKDSIKNVAAGTYTLTVTDAHGCRDIVSVTIGNGSGITSTLSSKTDVICHGGSNGSITINTTGGAIPYTYHWGSATNTTNTHGGYSAGSYVITVTDNNGCSATVPATITEPAALAHAITTVPASCGGSDGKAKVIESGGSPAYSYLWSGGLGTKDSIVNISAGNYTLTVTDAHGCTDIVPVSVANTGGANASITGTTDVTCPGGSDGSITASASGGSIPYTYHWGIATNSNTTQAGFSAGTFVITVTDNAGCITTVSADINQPPPIVITPMGVAVSCHNATDGTASVSVTGGTPGYSYLWNADSTTSAISNMPSGTYTVAIIDQHQCTASATAVIGNPDSIAIVSAAIPQSCVEQMDGEVSLHAIGGTPMYSYQWAPVSGSDSILSGLSAGPYSYTVTDSRGCTTAGASAVAITPPIIPHAVATDPLCPPLTNGSIIVNPAGGNPTYNYAWSNLSQSAINSPLDTGTYYLTITDAKGCTQMDTFILSYAGSLSVEAGDDQTIDMGQSATLTAVTSKPGDFTYTWSPDYNLACTACQASVASPLQTFTYVINVTDTSGCRASDSVTIFVKKNYNLYVPNAFSPNGDGINDYFEIYGNKSSWKYVGVMIFNRWGEKVFESNDIDFKWDGRFKNSLQEPNVYVYVLTVTFIDGYTIRNQKGSLTLIR
jgi:gliding motility-associated-like protein